MTFNQKPLPRVDITPTDDAKGGRLYQTPFGNFESVTTILKRVLPSARLDKWIERTGVDKASQIVRSASNQGMSIHHVFEKYLLGDPSWQLEPAVNKMAFMQVKPFIDKNITSIFGTEFRLYSKLLRAAGTADLLVEFAHKYNTVVDFKRSRKRLKPDDDRILKYQYQATVYGIMVEEMYSMPMPFNMIIVMNIEDCTVQYLIERNEQYREKVINLFQNREERKHE